MPHPLADPSHHAQTQWELACQELQREFELSATDLPTIDLAHGVFLELVGQRTLSQEACNALMYALYFCGYLSMLRTLQQQSAAFEVPDQLNTHPVLQASNRWAQQARDAHALQQLAQPVIQDTHELLELLN